MRIENKRIFINDLPETTTPDELKSNFSKYGQVSSVEIKERKELGLHNKSLFFAYINLITDDRGIDQCFKELRNTQWHGQYVHLQIARESFLERLRREREENQKNEQSNISEVTEAPVKPITLQNGLKSTVQQVTSPTFQKKVVKKYKSSTESGSESSGSEKSTNNPKTFKIAKKTQVETISSAPKEKLDIIIKDNRGKFVDKNGLKIPSVGKEPIFKVTKNKAKSNDSVANLKRLQSLQDMKKSYAAQKSLIKNSLSYGVNKPNKKIVFNDDDSKDFSSNIRNNGLKKNSLFNSNKLDDDDSDFEANFEFKEQFEGKSGQKLLELQSKYKNDKRFALDKRFLDDEGNEDEVEPMETQDVSEENFEAEREVQLKILGEVLGKKVTPSKEKSEKDSVKKKAMLRFDPSQPDHSNFEITVTESKEKKKKNKKAQKEEQELIKLEPEVSKEVFYKVNTDNLKETFEEKQQFSLLSMFGKVEEDKEDIHQDEEKEIKRNPLMSNQNPFKYDSSDDEDQTEDIPHKDESANTSHTKFLEQKITRTSPAVFWTEPFFFKADDFRLQEGLDFIEKIKTENKEFVKIRRDLKGIVKAKVRNNERKNKMFKKKLGGSKRRKHIRIRKALKR